MWDTRAFTAIAYSLNPPIDRTIIHMLIRAAWGYKGPAPGQTWYPHLGENAMIDKERQVWSRMFYDEKDVGVARIVCSVDDLNATLGWLLSETSASDAEYTAVVNKFNAWIARDETQMGIHVERQREAIRH